jgi:hypothetical protein
MEFEFDQNKSRSNMVWTLLQLRLSGKMINALRCLLAPQTSRDWLS